MTSITALTSVAAAGDTMGDMAMYVWATGPWAWYPNKLLIACTVPALEHQERGVAFIESEDGGLGMYGSANCCP